MVCKYGVIVDELGVFVNDMCVKMEVLDVGEGNIVVFEVEVKVVCEVFDKVVEKFSVVCKMVVKFLDVVVMIEFVLFKMECVVFIIEILVDMVGLEGIDVVFF